MLRQYFNCNERLEIFLTCFCNILCYVGRRSHPQWYYTSIHCKARIITYIQYTYPLPQAYNIFRNKIVCKLLYNFSFSNFVYLNFIQKPKIFFILNVRIKVPYNGTLASRPIFYICVLLFAPRLSYFYPGLLLKRLPFFATSLIFVKERRNKPRICQELPAK